MNWLDVALDVAISTIEWARSLDWKTIAQATIPLLIAGVLLNLIGFA